MFYLACLGEQPREGGRGALTPSTVPRARIRLSAALDSGEGTSGEQLT
jgi:hypothetical protein